MASNGTTGIEALPEPVDIPKLEPAKKRKRTLTDSNGTPVRAHSTSDERHHSDDRSNNDSRPIDSYDARPEPVDVSKLEPAKRKNVNSPRPGDDDDEENRPRKKRPTGRNRLTDAEKEAIRQRQLQREREQQEAIQAQNARGIHDAVRQHYNAVPERGRDWRRTDSRIKGLRSFNNWIKSTIIQKFSPSEEFLAGPQQEGDRPPPNLLVLDIGCGKGGDLGKWQQAPQPVDLYVGLDPAEVSIDQARGRYSEMRSGGGRGGRGGGRGGYRRAPPRIFHAEFAAWDCFGQSIAKVPIVKEVGFDASGGPSRFGGGKFDVVSMMFCMHYAFESEEKARQMLSNVAGALKKGGRLIGCIPNSDVLSENVVKFNKKQAEQRKAKEEADAMKKAEGGEEKTDDTAEDGEVPDQEYPLLDKTAEWGNDIYKVRFAAQTPADGIFRPPFGWKYNFFLHEAVEEVPEYVVPWEAFRAIAEDFNLEMQYHKTFEQVWESEKDDNVLGPLSERMGVRERGRGPLLVSPEEMEAANFYSAFCFYKV